MRKRSANVAAATKCFICAKAKRQRQNVLSARKRSGSDKMFYLRESEAAAIKAHSRNGNQPHVLVMNLLYASNKLEVSL
ncbi:MULTISPECIES: hypothetical protein [Lysinibacillus]|uniref:Uncharacterized protein n=1 Tax=Lysinibacillus xylanilyticus TaxID=582475 RepID=A0ABV3VV67_9BACI